MDIHQKVEALLACIPKSDYSREVAKTFGELLSKIDVQSMEIAHLHSLLTECGNELFQCGDDGLWITDGYQGGFMWCFCQSLNEIIHGVPRSR